MDCREIIRNSVYALLKDEPFFAHFILNSNVVYDQKSIPTAAVTVRHGVPTFIFNSEFMGNQTTGGAKNILKHEVLHLVFEHTSKKFPDGEELGKVLYNIAADCAINQYLTDLPNECVSLQNVSEKVGYKLDAWQTADYYYEHLRRVKWPKAPKGEKGLQTLDEHQFGGEGDEDGEEGAGDQQVNTAAVRNLAKKALKQAAGNAPASIVAAIDAMGDATIPWKQVLRNFVMTRVTSTIEQTRKKVNRRYPLPAPGKKKKRSLTMGVCLDSSGSVSDEQYTSFMNEVKSIAKNVEKTYLIHADCQVQKVEVLTAKTKLEPTRKGYGGTAYQPAIDECKKLGCDVIIYFGDFDTSDTPTNPKVPFLWVGVGSQPAPANFGKVLRI